MDSLEEIQKALEREQRRRFGAKLDFISLLVTVIFVTLKLTRQIFWSWWWVLAPLWVPVAILLIVACITLAIAKGIDMGDRR